MIFWAPFRYLRLGTLSNAEAFFYLHNTISFRLSDAQSRLPRYSEVVESYLSGSLKISDIENVMPGQLSRPSCGA
jgi:hypothetical protein